MKTSRLAISANPSGRVRLRAFEPAFPAGESISRCCGTAWRFLAAALAYCLLAFAATAFAAVVSWNRNAEADIVRYQVQCGTTSGSYNRTINAGNATSVSVTGLEPGVTYYLAVSAVNEAGLVGAPSAEVIYQEPAAPLEPATLVPQAGWTLRCSDSEEGGNYAAVRAFDGDAATFWHTRWTGGTTPPPHEIQIDLGAIFPVKGFRYLPRQDSYSVGNISQYEFYTSLDGSNWGDPAASGSFANGSSEKQVTFTNRNARYIRLRGLSEVSGGANLSVAELNLLQGDPIETAANRAPVAEAKSISLAEDSALAVALGSTDPDGDSLSFAVITGPSRGTLSGTAPNLIYTPAANFNGVDWFTFKSSDGILDSNIATVSINVAPVNDAPVAQSQSVATQEDTSVPVVLSATDVEGSALIYSVLSGPSKGTLSGTAPNLTYTPTANSNGADSFTYRATDGVENSNVATVSIAITAVNDAPVASARSAVAVAGVPTSIGLTANDVEGSPLTYAVVSGPSHGILTGTAPNLTYTAASDYSGADSFTFRASDGSAVSNIATVAVTVNAAPGADEVIPNRGWKLHYADSEEAPSYQATRAFDGNPDSFWHTRFTSGATPPPHEIQIDLGGLYQLRGFRYLPRQDSSLIGNIGTYAFHTSMDGSTWGSPAATGSFTNDHDLKQVVFSARNARFIRLVCLSEANGAMHASVAELMLLGTVLANSTPSAADLAFAANKNSACQITLEGSDPDGDVLTFGVVSGPSHGKLTGSGASRIYRPEAGFTGEDSFVYSVSDGSFSAEAAVIIRVSNRISGGNNAPVFKVDPIRAGSAVESQPYVGGSLAGIAADPDKGDEVHFSITSGPEWLKIAENGKLSGTPPSGSGGVHRFKVKATDDAGASADAELIIEIQKNLPLPWDLELIGETGRNGGAGKSSNGSLTLTGGGGLAGHSDAGTFVWQTLSGDGQVIARVDSLDDAGPNTRAGIMIRESLSSKSAHAFLGVNGAGDFRWVCRARKGNSSRVGRAGKGSLPDSWLKLTRNGEKLTAFRSTDGEGWVRVGSVSLELGKHCYVGLMVSGGKNRQATASFRNVNIRP